VGQLGELPPQVVSGRRGNCLTRAQGWAHSNPAAVLTPWERPRRRGARGRAERRDRVSPCPFQWGFPLVPLLDEGPLAACPPGVWVLPSACLPAPDGAATCACVCARALSRAMMTDADALPCRTSHARLTCKCAAWSRSPAGPRDDLAPVCSRCCPVLVELAPRHSGKSVATDALHPNNRGLCLPGINQQVPSVHAPSSTMQLMLFQTAQVIHAMQPMVCAVCLCGNACPPPPRRHGRGACGLPQPLSRLTAPHSPLPQRSSPSSSSSTRS
jgi:hypothetical protein